MLELSRISFAYNTNHVVNDINLAVANGSHMALIGESGCGKSTLLKLIYGLLDPIEGTITFNNVAILGPKFRLVPGEDYIKYLAQDFDLMPYITVAENVGKFLSNIDKEAKKARITELLELVEMIPFANVKAKDLSGGQQQRVALARVLALEPQLLLLDEPFSQIDTFRANALRRSVYNYVKQKGITCIVATHDSIDVLESDFVVVMRNGNIIQTGTANEVYENPASNYVATLFGHVNQINAAHLNRNSSDESLLLYPHQLRLSDAGLAVTVIRSYYRGSHFLIESLFHGGKVFFDHTSELPPGALVTIARK